MEALAAAVRVLCGRDRPRPRGLTASSCSSTGGAQEEWGGRGVGGGGGGGGGVLFAYRDLGIELHVGYQGPPNAVGAREYLAGCEVDCWGQAVGAGALGEGEGEGEYGGGGGGGGRGGGGGGGGGGAGGGDGDGGGGASAMGHGRWLVELRALRLQGLQLEGLVLQEADVRCISEGLENLEVGVAGVETWGGSVVPEGLP